MRKLFSLAVIGLAARWLLDSAHGAERRARLRERIRGLAGGVPRGTDALQGARDAARAAAETTRDAAHAAAETTREAADRATAAASEAIGRDTDAAADDSARRAGSPDDARLTDKVESELFRGDDVPKGAVNVNVEFGKVVLRGEVESRELIDDLVERARAIDGVRDVESLLHLPGEPAPMHE